MFEWKNAGDHASHVKLFDVPYDTIPYPTKLPVGRLVLTFSPDTSLTDFRLNLMSGDASIWHSRPAGGTASAMSSITTTFDRSRAVLLLTGFPGQPDLKLIPPGGVSKLGYPAAESGHDDTSVWFLQNTIKDGSYAVAAAYVKSVPPNKGQPFRSSVAIVARIVPLDIALQQAHCIPRTTAPPRRIFRQSEPLSSAGNAKIRRWRVCEAA